MAEVQIVTIQPIKGMSGILGMKATATVDIGGRRTQFEWNASPEDRPELFAQWQSLLDEFASMAVGDLRRELESEST